MPFNSSRSARIFETTAPFLSLQLSAALAVGRGTAWLNATGSDDISLATGLGNFGGTFTVVVQGDNAMKIRKSRNPGFITTKIAASPLIWRASTGRGVASRAP